MLRILSSLFERDINKLDEEISLYKNETDLWKTGEGITNPGGNLALHLIGNLNHFIGATLGHTGYVRDRDKEFALKDIPREKLADEIKNASAVVAKTLASLSEDDLEKDFPVPFNNEVSTTGFILIFLLAHLNYHLGQINYHRRLVG